MNPEHSALIVSQLSLLFENREQLPDEERLFKLARNQADILSDAADTEIVFLEEEIAYAVKTLQSRYTQSMSLGTVFSAEDYKPWLADKQGEIQWYYFNRYKRHLVSGKGFPAPVLRSMNSITDTILDRMEDPAKDGNWARKGLVVGHVQSGKTANYTGLICKAADAGYKVIIVLAGVLNSLRAQTQERLDHDFVGYCSRIGAAIGAAHRDNETLNRAPRRPVMLTSADNDFHKNKIPPMALESITHKEPVVFVIKKNVNTLKNLHNWLKTNNKYNLSDFPMLMIDDEADNASINVNKPDKNVTAINKGIRKILSLFNRNCYVGYTATPFANIFINPDSADDMLGDDLFPRDFILSLDPPSNYVGPEKIFSEESELNCLQIIDDNRPLLPERHKIDFRPEKIPQSMLDAINCFILAKAVRLQRNQTGKNHSMMINVSRFTAVQQHLKDLVHSKLVDLREAINNYCALGEAEALQNPQIRSLKSTWDKCFNLSITWQEIQGLLKKSVDPMQVICVNKDSQDSLDYNNTVWPNGRSIIAIGGMSLSRGLTLEGLLVSYFLRNSIMYDTLMQMGRWFGYRDGYEDVCKVFMTADAASWYAHIAESTEELRDEFKRMERSQLTPKEFGLRVRTHPSSLIVTARNKMQSGRKVPVNISLAGRVVETSVIHADNKSLEHNKATLHELIAQAIQNHGKPQESKLGYLWKGVSSSLVMDTIRSFKNHNECMSTYPEPLVAYLEELEKNNCQTCDILLRSNRGGNKDARKTTVCGLEVTHPQRTVSVSDNRIVFSKRRIASRGDESAGIDEQSLQKLKADHDQNTPDHVYRKFKSEQGIPPLFMLNLVDAQDAEKQQEAQIVGTWGLSFPGDRNKCDITKTVTYMVNTTYWRNEYAENLDEEYEDEIDN